MPIYHRPIRSYVRREGRMTAAQRKALETGSFEYGLEKSVGMFDFLAIFGRKAPIVLEIGFGMGHSLASQASKEPDHDFIGIEVHRPGIGSLLAVLQKDTLKNVRVVCADAVEVLKECIPDHTLDKVQLFFPDPWPKQRHQKRRLVQSPFVELLSQKLKPQGQWHIATDCENYANSILNLMTHTSSFTKNDGILERPMTKFEQRGLKRGHLIYDLIFTKK